MLCRCWNQKFLDYEIETRNEGEHTEAEAIGWNQKFLDYEIETPTISPKDIVPLCWNQKFLDYEIETDILIQRIHYPDFFELESKVSRLRD